MVELDAYTVCMSGVRAPHLPPNYGKGCVVDTSILTVIRITITVANVIFVEPERIIFASWINGIWETVPKKPPIVRGGLMENKSEQASIPELSRNSSEYIADLQTPAKPPELTLEMLPSQGLISRYEVSDDMDF